MLDTLSRCELAYEPVTYICELLLKRASGSRRAKVCRPVSIRPPCGPVHLPINRWRVPDMARDGLVDGGQISGILLK